VNIYSYTARILICLIPAFSLFTPELFPESIKMEYLQSGTFWMGDNKNLQDEKPAHPVSLSSFHVDVKEVHIWHWEKVSNWAIKNGYEFSDSTQQRKEGPYWYDIDSELIFPMNMVNWYDAIKWCNARSELEGRTPVYYTDNNHSSVYRTGEIDLKEGQVAWLFSGYRLPTEAEWEYAARGGAYSLNYPWGNSLDGSRANYFRSGDPFDNASTPVGYFNGNQQIIDTANSFSGENVKSRNQLSRFGLYDLVGNVSEWCWDWYYDRWYSESKARKENTRGPPFDFVLLKTRSDMITRVARGGNFRGNPGAEYGNEIRIAYRHTFLPTSTLRRLGIRCVRADIEDPLWLNAVQVEDFPNWFFLPWFGYYWKSNDTWIFHYKLGWIYPVGKGSYDNWLFLPDHGWMWTGRYVYPYFYSDKDSVWYEYDDENSSFGWFTNVLTAEKQRFGRNYTNTSD
jgi:formylglycine-generating enzyme required for sulfatase activity